MRAGGEGAVLGVPPAVLRVDRRVVRHDVGSDPRDGASDRPASQEGQHEQKVFNSMFCNNEFRISDVWSHWPMLLQTLKKPAKAGSKHDGKRKTLKEEIVAVGSCT